MPVYTQYPTTYTVNLRLGYLALLHNKYANAKTYYEAASKALPLAFSPKLGLMATAIAQSNWDLAEQYGYQVSNPT
jgi:uncharacterized protein HemY